MKTVEIGIYQFDELSESAKQSAIEHFRQLEYEDPFIIDEAHESFKLFADIFAISWSNIDYEEPHRNNYSIKLDEQALELEGQRLSKYIWNNHKNDLFKGKYYGRLSKYDKHGEKILKSKEHPIGQRHVLRHSNCQLDNSCVLTGMCYDDDLLTPIYEFLNNPKDIDFETLLDDCVYSLCHSVQSELEYRRSDGALSEHIEINEYEFTANGEIY